VLKVGTLVVDMFDANTKALIIWQGSEDVRPFSSGTKEVGAAGARSARASVHSVEARKENQNDENN